ncbi:MAG: orotidine-5'-phosphate decarboxylase [Phycisphaerales bacterium]|jgi:orotidine-5'-phosphate decarboxylase|nr:orotidine-5'-phosphate decarboxylase [Phycisphaerales bacterium]
MLRPVEHLMQRNPDQLVCGPAKRLVEAMDRSGSAACVGLDPVVDRLPPGEPVEAIRAFSLGVIDAVAEHVACIKIQSACYERHGPDGLRVVDDVLAAAADRDVPVILDAKRGDIGVSAAHYAAAAFERPAAPDWLTVNGWLGGETIQPYLTCGGVFVLVRTSNPGAGEVQQLKLADGRTMSEAMADLVAGMAAARPSWQGWTDVGAVVGATHPAEAEALRARMPGVILLVPGIGAQGGTVDDCGPLFGPDGHGALVTASRSVIYAAPTSAPGWATAVSDAAAALAEESGAAAGLR